MNKALNYALKLLTYRPRTQKEIINALQAKGHSENEIKLVIDYLTDLDYLNDIKFMESWVYFRQHVSPRGRRFVKQELICKGISEICLNEFFDQVYSKKKEEACVLKLVQDWINRKFEIDFEDDKKLTSFLTKMHRKGFDYHLVLQAYNRLKAEQLDIYGKK